MRIIAEVLGMAVFLGLIILGVAWIIDNVEVKEAGRKLWRVLADRTTNDNTTSDKQ